MTPRVTIDTADIPGGGGQLRLVRRGAEFSITLGANELMNSRLSGSEEALAALSCGPVAGRTGARVLIGGLGMGFTLRAALGALRPDAEVLVAELVPAVVRWARGPLAEIFGPCLDDTRVTLFEGDVRRPIADARAGFDAILLDVDNGPEGLTRDGNDRLYNVAGLAAARAALRPGGNLAVWSGAGAVRFTARLRDAGFAVEEHAVKARGGKGARHVIWIATRR